MATPCLSQLLALPGVIETAAATSALTAAQLSTAQSSDSPRWIRRISNSFPAERSRRAAAWFSARRAEVSASRRERDSGLSGGSQ